MAPGYPGFDAQCTRPVGKAGDASKVFTDRLLIRTARSRTSGAFLFVVLLIVAPTSQGLEPPATAARFTGGGARAGAGAGEWSGRGEGG